MLNKYKYYSKKLNISGDFVIFLHFICNHKKSGYKRICMKRLCFMERLIAVFDIFRDKW